MNIDPTKPFKIVYPIFHHSILGFLVESFVVPLKDSGRFSLSGQNISSKNWQEFEHGLTPEDIELIQYTDEIQEDKISAKIVKEYKLPKKKDESTGEHLLRIFNDRKTDKLVQQEILNYVQRRLNLIFPKLKDKLVFEMSSDGNPAGKRLTVADEPLDVAFKLVRHADKTVVEPIVKYKGEPVKLYKRNLTVLNEQLGWFILDDHLYHLPKEVKISQLKKFSDTYQEQIIPPSGYNFFYGEFLPKRLANQRFLCTGVDVQQRDASPKLIVSFKEVVMSGAPVTLFAEVAAGEVEEAPGTDEQTRIQFNVQLDYAGYTFNIPSGHDDNPAAFVVTQQRASQYNYLKLPRQPEQEEQLIRALRTAGLVMVHGKATVSKGKAQELLMAIKELEEEWPIKLQQRNEAGKTYFLGSSQMQVSILERNDWFELTAVIQFGPYQIPFHKLRRHIVAGKDEFTLPNGEIAIIPPEWFTQYMELFSHAEGSDEDDEFKLGKHYLTLVNELKEGNLAQVTISQRLEKLREFTELEPYDLPEKFNATLRPYQKAGYDWLMFLNSYRLGGCLADDMGLGKTVQTLALLAKQKELVPGSVSLLVMPTSLVYNWQQEARRFTPHLRVLNHTGTQRDKTKIPLLGYDLVITSYGTLRSDIELFKACYFHYVILDESQAIKNPSSIVSKATTQLRSTHRLILTGTPLENSTLDLWSQMNFVNPGLLGTQGFFKKHYLQPIEKKNDQHQKRRLHALIKPFLLRRNKKQVATELPEKVESLLYCGMSDEQAELYEKAKNYYRNQIMDQIETQGMGRSRLVMLRGLTRLRQLANHPAMVDPDYTGGSGKLDDVFYKIQDIVQEDHKILVFSQFVRHLDQLRKRMDAEGIQYLYLDGSTRDRKSVVEEFQHGEKGIQVFLISLKAGGVGLNLTAADYVFILDPWWNPAVEAQAIDRAHRIGQDKTVFTYKFITQDTVEEKILGLQQRKQALIQDIISTEESFVKSLTLDDIAEILR